MPEELAQIPSENKGCVVYQIADTDTGMWDRLWEAWNFSQFGLEKFEDLMDVIRDSVSIDQQFLKACACGTSRVPQGYPGWLQLFSRTEHALHAG